MLQLYTWTTPNGIKPLIMLEELGIPYETHWVDIGKGAQHEPSFLEVNPNAKIPALADGPLRIFESGAILIYLGEKAGRLLPSAGQPRADTLAWLMFQMGGVGPMLGQAHHFRIYAPDKIPYAVDRYTNEARRLYGVIDKRLAASEWLGGAEYSIADIATFPWLRSWQNQGIVLEEYPHLKRWFDTIAERPAVQRGVKVLADLRKPITDDKAREVLFGTTQYARR